MKNQLPTQAITPTISGRNNHPKKLQRTLMVICGMLAILLYANTISHDYVLDDDMAIVKNTFVQEGISAIPKIFTTPYRAGFSDRNEGLYRPLSIALFAIQWQLAAGVPVKNM